MTKQVLSVVGARPQFIKAAVVSRLIDARDGLDEILVHTGQHYDSNMSEIFFRELGIRAPAHNLEVGGGSHGQMTGAMLEKLEALMMQRRPDAVLVYGDTNSTLAGALAASKLLIPVIHVEAGLRSFNRAMPEEINRVLVDHLSQLLMCPTKRSVDNLRDEGIVDGVLAVGDVMHDAALFAKQEALRVSTVMERLGLSGQSFALCTVHRAENTDNAQRLAAVFAFLAAQAEQRAIVLPLHPRTRKKLEEHKIPVSPRIMIVEPLGYFDLHRLLASCELVLTDSGGVQKEAYFHRKDCITMRDETEWVETVEAGWNRLWTNLESPPPKREIDEYGAGDAGPKMVDAIERFLASRFIA